MGRCNVCAGLTVEETRLGNATYHTSLRALRDSAVAGCGLCRLWWASVQQGYDAKTVDAVLAGMDPDAEGQQPLRDERPWLTGSINYHERGEWSDKLEFSKPNQLRGGSQLDLACGNRDDPEATVAPPVLSSSLNVFAEPGTPAASHIDGRYFTADWNPDGHVEFARTSLGRCRSRHPECGPIATDMQPEMPTRILDVGFAPGATKLILSRSRGLREPYLALSYCWGQGVRHATELNDGNLAFLLESVNEDALAVTHQECIAMARQLGIRYVWIDSLCIIQKNAADWNYESKRMDEVYGNAALTIVAGRAADSRAGFLTNRIEQRAPPCAMPSGMKDEDGGDLGDVFLSLTRAKVFGHTDGRGWCYQEKVLSKRMLVYAAEQLGFMCQRIGRWEDGALTVHDSYQLHVRLFRNPFPDNASTNAEQQQVQERLRTEMLQLWYQDAFRSYSLRRLTNPDDIFAAISSIAQLAQRSIRSRYLAGIWEVDMVRGLLWYTQFSISSRKTFQPLGLPPISGRPRRPTDGDGKGVVRAPSWSWASIEGQVYNYSKPQNERPYRDPSNFLIQPLFFHSNHTPSPDTLTPTSALAPARVPRWTLLPNPGCDADVLSQPHCELCFLGRPKHVQLCQSRTKVERSDFPERWPVAWWYRRTALTEQGYLALLEPAESEYLKLNELDLLAAEDTSPASPAPTFAVACFDIAEDRVGITDCWFLPLLKERCQGLLLRKDPLDAKFRRLGLVTAVQEKFIPWLASGPEEEVHLV
ncbi:HET-domain-containing protein [Hypoxylon crocopeplum]|nr:HET-domain-containing protein [Hypoxylon crocopeplum]